jgi:hypothetical protein
MLSHILVSVIVLSVIELSELMVNVLGPL